MKSDKVIGVDLGGTNIRAGVVGLDGVFGMRGNAATPNKGTAADISDAIEDLLDDFARADGIEAVGIALAAVTDPTRNEISASPNLPQLAGFALAGRLRERTGLNVYLENDATAAAVGEHWLGSGRPFKHMICVTLGTGVGGGLILNDAPFYGADGNAGEIGHICLDVEGPPCGCGSNGCLEQYSSATAIARIAKELLPRHPASPLHSRFEINAEDVYKAALDGDTAALEAFAIAGRYLGMALAGLVNVLNPEAIVIAGGAAASWEFLIGPVRDEVGKRAFQQPAERVKIVRGTLRNDAGVLGAAKRAFSGKGST